MKIAITADSSIDLTQKLKEEYGIITIPVNITLGDEEVLDGVMTNEEMFAWVEKNKILPKTSAINAFAFQEFFEKILKDYDAIIHFDISGDISSMYSNAVAASKAFGDRVEVVDSRVLTSAIGLLAIYARKLIDGGNENIRDIADKVRARIPFVQASFVIERLDYLYKGGRCSSLALLGANVLKLRPQIVLKNGKMVSAKKYRGKMPQVVKNYCQDVFAEFNHPDKEICFITASSATPEMFDEAKKAVEAQGFKNVYVTTAGMTVASHCGANTLGILYMNDGNE